MGKPHEHNKKLLVAGILFVLAGIFIFLPAIIIGILLLYNGLKGQKEVKRGVEIYNVGISIAGIIFGCGLIAVGVFWTPYKQPHLNRLKIKKKKR